MASARNRPVLPCRNTGLLDSIFIPAPLNCSLKGTSRIRWPRGNNPRHRRPTNELALVYFVLAWPAPTVAEAVFSRCISAVNYERAAANRSLTYPWQPLHRGQGGIHPSHRQCAVLLKNQFLCLIPTHSQVTERIWLSKTRLQARRTDFPRRLYHLCDLPSQNHRGS